MILVGRYQRISLHGCSVLHQTFEEQVWLLVRLSRISTSMLRFLNINEITRNAMECARGSLQRAWHAEWFGKPINPVFVSVIRLSNATDDSPNMKTLDLMLSTNKVQLIIF